MTPVLQAVKLEDKYARMDGRVHITGSQALVRLAILQSMRDRAAGLNTAAYIAGYRGSPMHNLDKELWRAGSVLDTQNIHFWPAINEDLAATAIWGTQQIHAFGDATVDGVFGMWYGKGPGLDRSMDAIRHGHIAGSAEHGGVLVVVGDDHALTSTDAPAAHEYAFVEMMMPLLYPADVQDIIDYGLFGYAMSRFSGCWTGFKVIPDTVDASTSLDASPDRLSIVLPDDFERPADGLNLRVPDFWHQQEPRHRAYKLDAALAFARANNLNHTTIPSAQPRFGIVASGKAYNDVRQALQDLGITDARASESGIVLMKMAMLYPFDDQTLLQFADGLEEVLIVEEKHQLTENGVRNALYHLPDSRRPRVVGQFDERGQRLLPIVPELTPEDVGRAIAARIEYFHQSDQSRAYLRRIDELAKKRQARTALSIVRQPYFCSGCPHNSSTKVPQGSRAHGGVGCHYMATYMDRDNFTHSHMGGEGLTWVGQSAFVKTDHVFQNMGDGTYYHSGLLAIRACIAARVNITFKILFNDAVAMTGGQPVDGQISPAIISRQVHAEGVDKIVVVSDQPEQYSDTDPFAPGTIIRHRDELDQTQRECRAHPGASVLIYDQTCAAEKRRRRKSGKMEDPDKRIFINDRVCEGCGDCGVASNCMSVAPLDTAFGRKRAIDQSACNKDYSCVKGFCPSFVSVLGGKLKKSAAVVEVPAHLRMLPEPERPALEGDAVYSILVTGVGGTGVVTIGTLLSMAVHMEGKHFSTVDQFGMAQKGGAVTSHIRLANHQNAVNAVRLNAGSADLVLGCDSLVTASDVALNAMSADHTYVIQNTHQQITGQFNRDPKLRFPVIELDSRLAGAVNSQRIDSFNASDIATRLLGDSIASNLFMLGYAYQKGLIPVSARAIEAAIELNNVAIELNKQAFVWGRRAARDLPAIVALAQAAVNGHPTSVPQSLDAALDLYTRELAQYQSQSLARRYRRAIEAIAKKEQTAIPGSEHFSVTVARSLYKLMAYKDEYEVARLYSSGQFIRDLEQRFDGDYQLRFHLAPPLFARRDPVTGHLLKKEFGGWMLGAFKVLSRFKFLRGTPFDPFGYTGERRQERALIREFQTMAGQLADELSPERLDQAVAIAALADEIRGYGHVKEASIEDYKRRLAEPREMWQQPPDAARRRA